MRRITMRQLQEEYDGILPADATLCEDEEEAGTAAAAPSPAKPEGRSHRGRFAVLNEFTDVTMRSLGLADVKVWLILFRDTRPNGLARTGQTDIAERTGLSVRSVKVALRRLRAAGIVERVRCGRLNGGPSVYRVHGTGRMG
jgi:DNA-binding transcriptional ArsR family regulator